MKYLIPVLILFLIVSCNSEEKKTKTTPVQDVPLNERPIPANPNGNSNASLNVVGGAHYLCPQKHPEGNSASAGTCPKCTNTLVHNQGFHATQQTTPSNNTTPINNQQSPASNTSPTNANGVYHYTCSNGCSGGSGAAGNCVTCGNTLAHNQAYHS